MCVCVCVYTCFTLLHVSHVIMRQLKWKKACCWVVDEEGMKGGEKGAKARSLVEATEQLQFAVASRRKPKLSTYCLLREAEGER